MCVSAIEKIADKSMNLMYAHMKRPGTGILLSSPFIPFTLLLFVCLFVCLREKSTSLNFENHINHSLSPIQSRASLPTLSFCTNIQDSFFSLHIHSVQL